MIARPWFGEALVFDSKTIGQEKEDLYVRVKKNKGYTNEELFKSIFRKEYLVKVILIFYSLLGLTLIDLFIIGNSYYRSLSGFLHYELGDMLTFVGILCLVLPVMLGIVLTYQENFENKFLIKPLVLGRIFVYLAIGTIFGFYLIRVRTDMGNIASRYPEWYASPIINQNLRNIFIIWLFPATIIAIGLLVIKRRQYNQNLMNKLLGSDLASKLTKYFLLTQLSEIKTALDTSDPLDFDIKFKIAIEKNLNRLKKSFKANNIKIRSKKIIKKYVLTIAQPLRESLREAIGKNFTEIYLRDENPVEDQVVNYEEIWRKINKAFLQWESGTNE